MGKQGLRPHHTKVYRDCTRPERFPLLLPPQIRYSRRWLLVGLDRNINSLISRSYRARDRHYRGNHIWDRILCPKRNGPLSQQREVLGMHRLSCCSWIDSIRVIMIFKDMYFHKSLTISRRPQYWSTNALYFTPIIFYHHTAWVGGAIFNDAR